MHGNRYPKSHTNIPHDLLHLTRNNFFLFWQILKSNSNSDLDFPPVFGFSESRLSLYIKWKQDLHNALRIFNIVNQSLLYQVNIEVCADKVLNNINSLHALKVELSSKGKKSLGVGKEVTNGV